MSQSPPIDNFPLDVFAQASSRVPAYAKFLAQHRIDPKKVKTLEDFKQIPIVTKQNYLKKFPLRDLLLDGTTADARIISMSSGSSGEPFFWFRGNQSVDESIEILDTVLDKTFQ